MASREPLVPGAPPRGSSGPPRSSGPLEAVTITVRDLTGKITVHEGVRPAETDVETFRAAVAAARGAEPALLRLVRGDVPLDDNFRTLAECGILGDAELNAVSQTAAEDKARTMAGFRAALSAGAAAWIAELLAVVGAMRLKLRNADGSNKHRRWVVWSIADDGALQITWGKQPDGAEHFAWKKLSYAAPKRRTVTGVREESPAANPLGLTVEVPRGAPVIMVAENVWARQFILDLAAAVVGPSRVGTLSDAAVESLLGCGCRSFADVRGMEAAALEGLGEVEAEVRAALPVSFFHPLRWAEAHSTIDISDGATLATDDPKKYTSSRGHPAVCGEVLEAGGEAFAEFTWVSGRSPIVGVARAGVDLSTVAGGLHDTSDGWMYNCETGGHLHDFRGHATPWDSGERQGITMGQTVGLLLRRGTLAVYIEGRRIGVLCIHLHGRLVWAADLRDGASVRIERRPTPPVSCHDIAAIWGCILLKMPLRTGGGVGQRSQRGGHHARGRRAGEAGHRLLRYVARSLLASGLHSSKSASKIVRTQAGDRRCARRWSAAR